ncbi:DUF6065 family protein [Methylorubrum extorquens]
MNGRFTRPGTVRFAKGECFCFIAPVPHETFDAICPHIRSFDDDPALKVAYEEWRSRHSTSQARIAAGEPDAVRAGWQRDHIAECDPADRDGPTFHRTKRSLPKPVRSAPGGADVALWNIAAFVAPPRLKMALAPPPRSSRACPEHEHRARVLCALPE